MTRSYSAAGDSVFTLRFLLVRWPLAAASLLHLLLWNYFIAGSWGGMSTGSAVALHCAVSALALIVLWFLARWMSRGRGLTACLIVCLAMALLLPTTAIWLFYAAPQLHSLRTDGLGQILLAASWVTLSAWPYWLGAGLGTFLLLTPRIRDWLGVN